VPRPPAKIFRRQQKVTVSARQQMRSAIPVERKRLMPIPGTDQSSLQCAKQAF